jgi:hypothetical protein
MGGSGGGRVHGGEGRVGMEGRDGLGWKVVSSVSRLGFRV